MVEPLEVRFTQDFVDWLDRLKDRRARRSVEARIDRLQAGNLGDAKPVGDAISELRIDQGPGYRVYFTKIDRIVVVLLCGGDKSTQQRDIALAKLLAAKLRSELP
jgi:putative addiction module killer protein